MSWAAAKASAMCDEGLVGSDFTGGDADNRFLVFQAIRETIAKCAQDAKTLVHEKFDGNVDGDVTGLFVQHCAEEIEAAIRNLVEP